MPADSCLAARFRFPQPIVVRLALDDRAAGSRAIGTVADGLAAVHRYGMERLRADPLWAQAVAALNAALVASDPSSVDDARDALCRLARAAGALADA